MAAIFRRLIANQVSQCLHHEANFIDNQIRIAGRNQKLFGFILPIANILENKQSKQATNTYQQCCEIAQDLAKQIQIDSHYIQNIIADKTFVIFKPNDQTFMTEILKNAINNNSSDFHYSNETKKHVLVEYSSPNIAKPFHVGHLRSTIIGNFIANINNYFGHKVTRINYLGDWGVQFGLLGVGFQKFGSQELLANNAIKHLFDVYVQTNREMTRDDSIKSQARFFAKRLEEDDEECIKLWKQFRDLSIKEYKKIYKRIYISFDEYSGESLYNKRVHDIIDQLQDDGKIAIDRQNETAVVHIGKEHVFLRKADRTTTYLSRDLVAAIDRFERYKFNEMYYVTASAQNLHFKHLFKILNSSDYDWAKNCYHIDFGMVKGMSTRAGNVIFLNDILDDAKERMLKTLSKGHHDPSSIAEQVGLAAILVQAIMKEKMLASQGDTGPRLQYEHARLVSIAKTTQVPINTEANITSLLNESCAINLVEHIARFETELTRAKTYSEPSFLVNYLFILSHLISIANHNLKVLGQIDEIAEARMLLFAAARNILATGLSILGIKPLNKM